ncbi:MAG: asparagine synthase (glutamine-hydrolyzing), partial [Flavobacteriales bacterium]
LILRNLPDSSKSINQMDDVLYSDLHLVLPNDMLTKVDLMSMSHGLEVRVPFLDHRIAEFAFSIPFDQKINNNLRKRIVQESFRSLLPEELFNRPKHGFEVPILKWFRNELNDLIMNDLLGDTFVQAQGIFELSEIQLLKKKLMSNDPGDSATHIWTLIVFQHWWKRYLN